MATKPWAITAGTKAAWQAYLATHLGTQAEVRKHWQAYADRVAERAVAAERANPGSYTERQVRVYGADLYSAILGTVGHNAAVAAALGAAPAFDGLEVKDGKVQESVIRKARADAMASPRTPGQDVRGILERNVIADAARLNETVIDHLSRARGAGEGVNARTLRADLMAQGVYDRGYQAERTARTTINDAFKAGTAQAVIAAGGKGVRWRLSSSHPGSDVCDGHASHDEGLGMGVWPADSVPASHPNCLCSLLPVVELPDGEPSAGMVPPEGVVPNEGPQDAASKAVERAVDPGAVKRRKERADAASALASANELAGRSVPPSFPDDTPAVAAARQAVADAALRLDPGAFSDKRDLDPAWSGFQDALDGYRRAVGLRAQETGLKVPSGEAAEKAMEDAGRLPRLATVLDDILAGKNADYPLDEARYRANPEWVHVPESGPYAGMRLYNDDRVLDIPALYEAATGKTLLPGDHAAFNKAWNSKSAQGQALRDAVNDRLMELYGVRVVIGDKTAAPLADLTLLDEAYHSLPVDMTKENRMLTAVAFTSRGKDSSDDTFTAEGLTFAAVGKASGCARFDLRAITIRPNEDIPSLKHTLVHETTHTKDYDLCRREGADVLLDAGLLLRGEDGLLVPTEEPEFDNMYPALVQQAKRFNEDLSIARDGKDASFVYSRGTVIGSWDHFQGLMAAPGLQTVREIADAVRHKTPPGPPADDSTGAYLAKKLLGDMLDGTHYSKGQSTYDWAVRTQERRYLQTKSMATDVPASEWTPGGGESAYGITDPAEDLCETIAGLAMARGTEGGVSDFWARSRVGIKADDFAAACDSTETASGITRNQAFDAFMQHVAGGKAGLAKETDAARDTRLAVEARREAARKAAQDEGASAAERVRKMEAEDPALQWDETDHGVGEMVSGKAMDRTVLDHIKADGKKYGLVVDPKTVPLLLRKHQEDLWAGRKNPPSPEQQAKARWVEHQAYYESLDARGREAFAPAVRKAFEEYQAVKGKPVVAEPETVLPPRSAEPPTGVMEQLTPLQRSILRAGWKAGTEGLSDLTLAANKAGVWARAGIKEDASTQKRRMQETDQVWGAIQDYKRSIGLKDSDKIGPAPKPDDDGTLDLSQILGDPGVAARAKSDAADAIAPVGTSSGGLDADAMAWNAIKDANPGITAGRLRGAFKDANGGRSPEKGTLTRAAELSGADPPSTAAHPKPPVAAPDPPKAAAKAKESAKAPASKSKSASAPTKAAPDAAARPMTPEEIDLELGLTTVVVSKEKALAAIPAGLDEDTRRAVEWGIEHGKYSISELSYGPTTKSGSPVPYNASYDAEKVLEGMEAAGGLPLSYAKASRQDEARQLAKRALAEPAPAGMSLAGRMLLSLAREVPEPEGLDALSSKAPEPRGIRQAEDVLRRFHGISATPEVLSEAKRALQADGETVPPVPDPRSPENAAEWDALMSSMLNHVRYDSSEEMVAAVLLSGLDDPSSATPEAQADAMEAALWGLGEYLAPDASDLASQWAGKALTPALRSRFEGVWAERTARKGTEGLSQPGDVPIGTLNARTAAPGSRVVQRGGEYVVLTPQGMSVTVSRATVDTLSRGGLMVGAASVPQGPVPARRSLDTDAQAFERGLVPVERTGPAFKTDGMNELGAGMPRVAQDTVLGGLPWSHWVRDGKFVASREGWGRGSNQFNPTLRGTGQDLPLPLVEAMAADDPWGRTVSRLHEASTVVDEDLTLVRFAGEDTRESSGGTSQSSVAGSFFSSMGIDLLHDPAGLLDASWTDLGFTSTTPMPDRTAVYAEGASGTGMVQVEMRITLKKGSRAFALPNSYSEVVLWSGTNYTVTNATAEDLPNGGRHVILYVEARNEEALES